MDFGKNLILEKKLIFSFYLLIFILAAKNVFQ